MTRVLVSSGLVAVGVVVLAPPGQARPQLDPVPPHMHFVQTASGDQVAVGPQGCGAVEGSALRQAFLLFHWNIHAGQPGGTAMDHEHNRTDIKAGACPTP
jgi:hypothetical protein